MVVVQAKAGKGCKPSIEFWKRAMLSLCLTYRRGVGRGSREGLQLLWGTKDSNEHRPCRKGKGVSGYIGETFGK